MKFLVVFIISIAIFNAQAGHHYQQDSSESDSDSNSMEDLDTYGNQNRGMNRRIHRIKEHIREARGEQMNGFEPQNNGYGSQPQQPLQPLQPRPQPSYGQPQQSEQPTYGQRKSSYGQPRPIQRRPVAPSY